MKLVFCLKCCDIRSPNKDESYTVCNCGNVIFRWSDPERGILKLKARDRNLVRVIGLNNQMLLADINVKFNDDGWKEIHQKSCEESTGYLFHKDKRNCWAVVIRVGQSSDVMWEE